MPFEFDRKNSSRPAFIQPQQTSSIHFALHHSRGSAAASPAVPAAVRRVLGGRSRWPMRMTPITASWRRQPTSTDRARTAGALTSLAGKHWAQAKPSSTLSTLSRHHRRHRHRRRRHLRTSRLRRRIMSTIVIKQSAPTQRPPSAAHHPPSATSILLCAAWAAMTGLGLIATGAVANEDLPAGNPMRLVNGEFHID